MSPPIPFEVTVQRKSGTTVTYMVTRFPHQWRSYTVIDQYGHYTYLPTVDVDEVWHGRAMDKPAGLEAAVDLG